MARRSVSAVTPRKEDVGSAACGMAPEVEGALVPPAALATPEGETIFGAPEE